MTPSSIIFWTITTASRRSIYQTSCRGESLYGETTYGVRYSATGNRFQGFPGWGKVRKYQLYDNKQDCKDSTHSCYDGWEELRELQMKEAAQETEE